MSKKHRELSCQNPSCTYDVRESVPTKQAVIDYLDQLSEDVNDDTVRHISVSVHRAE